MKHANTSGVWAKADKKRLFLTFLYLLLTLASGYAVMQLEGRYKRGSALLALLLFTFLFFRSAKKLLSDELQDAIDALFEKTMHILFWPLAFVLHKIAVALGIGRWRGWGEDEKTFIFAGRKKDSRKKRLKNEGKWDEQLDNKQRIRFLYIEYMIKRIRSGYLLRRQMTPHEISEELLLDDEEKLLFDTYDVARYAQYPQIDDRTVDKLYKMTARRREIRKD